MNYSSYNLTKVDFKKNFCFWWGVHLFCEGGVEIIEEEVEEWDHEAGGARHYVPGGQQGLAGAVIQVQEPWNTKQVGQFEIVCKIISNAMM